MCNDWIECQLTCKAYFPNISAEEATEDTNLQCSASGTTEDNLEIKTSWTSIGECGQYSLSWTGTALWDSTLNESNTATPTDDGSYSITAVMPYSEYAITLASEGVEIDNCTCISPETGENLER